jgi:hypothetical protein
MIRTPCDASDISAIAEILINRPLLNQFSVDFGGRRPPTLSKAKAEQTGTQRAGVHESKAEPKTNQGEHAAGGGGTGGGDTTQQV